MDWLTGVPPDVIDGTPGVTAEGRHQLVDAVLRQLMLPRLNAGDCELDALFAAICCLVVQKQTAHNTSSREQAGRKVDRARAGTKEAQL